MIFYYSGTGNTRWVAQQMGRLTGDKVVAMTDYMNHPELHTIIPTESVGICFPVYGWDAPAIAYDFMQSLQTEMEFSPPYLYYICTMGDDIGLTGQRLQQAATSLGWCFSAGFSLQMPNTYVCLPGFDVDSTEVRDAKLARVPHALQGIAENIMERHTGIFQLIPGRFAWLKTNVIGGYFRKRLMSDRKFEVNTACTGCGKCEMVCPVGNILMQRGRPTWQGHCTMCLACYHHCPHHALHWGSETRKKGQYLLTMHVKDND